MTDRIKQLIEQIKQLEDDLSNELHQHEDALLFHLKGKKVQFEKSVRQAHKQLKTAVIPWLFGIQPRNLLTAPIIYSMIIPLVISDLFVSFYQATCFPIYKITKVRRSDYLIFDRHHLAYLNVFEKFHCLYCAYANGVIAYIREIIGRTEQYFCPIKHARKALNNHPRYREFIPYGEAEAYHEKLNKFRSAMTKEE
ncbi:MAG: hypothetical protein GQ547_10095 [Methylophaga sp.]|nr:hypothetical protein [Methylophaga sp.]